ncbi:oxidative DNA demethylase [Ascoidea rubescens DSM 1968]|uniref:uS12 prolyl 3,4-dihydroxylase n=1 Tax=Ascoidea rubescens DSM 1968 TaxID=1344418 RepID=A0A1D2V9T3_9ASCO|nr:Fe II, 2-oxoglutarate-dependent dioxygenase [Ascoidea rubescens DSM 1968]ODV58295.1 Fe II, 2-oxoglutarate-dependent dioxygenase [Ascoidea rubescens DSM 1968]
MSKKSSKKSSKRTLKSSPKQSKKKLLKLNSLDRLSNKNFSEELKEIKDYFDEIVFDPNYKEEIKNQILDSQPYKWGHIDSLINLDLLKSVRNEILNEIHFTRKETDIYKVFQSGDLANLSGLDSNDLSRLPSLLKLRTALYSQFFRNFISYVTNSGKLSGIKQDMSLNTYTKHCHLLTHDDVIGSRRVSYILYLPDPNSTWKEHYGGSLRLFSSIVDNIPESDYHSKFIPQFNNFAFFKVQPGKSFHDVEEVKVDKQRISIQGWFHIPQKGEDGFIEGEEESYQKFSTLSSLQSKKLQKYDYPKQIKLLFPINEINLYKKFFNNYQDQFDNIKIEYLRKFLNPGLLELSQLKKLNDIFLNESIVEIISLLNSNYSKILFDLIKKSEFDEVMPILQNQIKYPWKLAIPSSKQRYMYIDGRRVEELNEDSINNDSQINSLDSPNFDLLKDSTNNKTLKELINLVLFLKSLPFKKWLSIVTSLVPISDQILIRRFRPGLDFTLATTIDEEEITNISIKDSSVDAVLEATLSLTPTKEWESGELGGYELCMSMEDGQDDPAVYRSAKGDSDDSVICISQASWNNVSIMLRDKNVMKFVKYVSWNAKGSRWDIHCQWNVQARCD